MVTNSDTFLLASSCIFFATIVVKLAVFTVASFAPFAPCPALFAFAYSRFIRCFCIRFCNCFFKVFSFICGFSSKNF